MFQRLNRRCDYIPNNGELSIAHFSGLLEISDVVTVKSV